MLNSNNGNNNYNEKRKRKRKKNNPNKCKPFFWVQWWLSFGWLRDLRIILKLFFFFFREVFYYVVLLSWSILYRPGWFLHARIKGVHYHIQTGFSRFKSIARKQKRKERKRILRGTKEPQNRKRMQD